MGAIATVAAVGYLGSKLGNKQKKQDVAGLTEASALTTAAMNPPPLPKPPSALDDQLAAGKAMTAAANRVRKQKGGGYGSTFLTGGNGDPTQAPTIRKSLLGV